MSTKKDAVASKNANEKKETVKQTSKAVEKKTNVKNPPYFEQMKKELEKLKKENEELKNNKLKLSFEDAQKLYLKKASLIKDLRVYEQKKEDIKNITLGSPEDSGLLDYDDYNLTFSRKSNYRDEKIITTSNKLIIKEFIPFIIEKLNKKISELKKEIETFEV